jgi:hypothetical protein
LDPLAGDVLLALARGEEVGGVGETMTRNQVTVTSGHTIVPRRIG